MINKKQDAFLEKCLEDIFKPFFKEIDLLKAKKLKASDPESKLLGSKIKLLEAYSELIGVRVLKLKSGYNPTLRDVQKFYETCLHESRKVTLSLQDHIPLKTLILQTIEKIANFCIKLLTFGNHPHFFSFTPIPSNKNMDEVKNLIDHIKSTVSEFINDPAKEQQVENGNNPGSPRV